jgi:hypothetical protein
MHDLVDPSELPTLRQLSMAAAGAAVVSLVLLVTAVLPAERGLDPTGVGTVLGLTQLGQMKMDEPHPPAPSVAEEDGFIERDTTLHLTLQPNQGAEIKAVMRAGDSMKYEWTADNGPLFFEFHGDEKGKPASDFTSYEKDTKQSSKGKFKAAFEGKHGWYWKNKNAQTVTVTLRTSGVYQSISKQ